MNKFTHIRPEILSAIHEFLSREFEEEPTAMWYISEDTLRLKMPSGRDITVSIIKKSDGSIGIKKDSYSEEEKEQLVHQIARAFLLHIYRAGFEFKGGGANINVHKTPPEPYTWIGEISVGKFLVIKKVVELTIVLADNSTAIVEHEGVKYRMKKDWQVIKP